MGRGRDGQRVRWFVTRALLLPGALVGGVWGCGDDVGGTRDRRGVRIAEVETAVAEGTLGETLANEPGAVGEQGRGLASAAGGADGRRYAIGAVGAVGTITGRVVGVAPRDTQIVPTHDQQACRPFREALVAGRQNGVAQAVVWLEGVARGPRPNGPRTVTLTYAQCRLAPRVQQVAVGGTVMVTTRDRLIARLRVTANGDTTVRETIFLTDAGQVVPSTVAAGTPGLVHVQDDKHPWAHAWLVVGPHPFVAITDDAGGFRLDGVPTGSYQLVAWHEQLGLVRQRVRIEAGVETKLELRF